MSVLILTPGGFDLIRETVRHLRAQTAHERIELVVVAPSREALGPFELEASGFARVRIVEAGEVRRASAAKALGVRATRAPFVAFAEEHCYPEPEWARLLLAAHARGWDAVGPQMYCPKSIVRARVMRTHCACCLRCSRGSFRTRSAR